MYFYHPGEGEGKIYMGLGAFVIVQFIGRLMDSVADPLVGYFSDKTKTRWGRRIPYIIFGTPPLAISMALVWFPITDHPSMYNNLWLAFNLLVFWLAYTIVVAPHLSLLPEIAPDDVERNRVGGLMGFGEVIGTLFGAAIFGILIGTYSHGIKLGPIILSDGFKMIGVFSAFGILLFFWFTWWFIKEKPYSSSKDVQLNFYQAARETLNNPSYPNFLVMIALLRLLVDIIFVLLPYYVIRLLGLSLKFAGGLSGAIILGAVIFFPLIVWASNKFGKKKVFSLALLSFALFIPLAIIIPFLPLEGEGVKTIVAKIVDLIPKLSPEQVTPTMFVSVCVFSLLAPGAAAFLVLSRVILTDVMDFDEKITGFRREAMYNGIEGLITKFAAGIAPMIVALNFFLFNMENGILTAFAMDALIALAAFLIFIPYPIRK
jgi:GPH family glycoside/pentoside/hexuronide:cation symporter